MRYAFIGGGSVIRKLNVDYTTVEINTEYGDVNLDHAIFNKVEIYSISRHSDKHSVSAHNVNYKKIVAAIKEIQPDIVFGISICGSFTDEINVGDILLIEQIIDKTSKRKDTFYDKDGDVRHIDVYDPLCIAKAEELQKLLVSRIGLNLKGVTIACIDGPRLSTKAELKYYKLIGADVVNMSIAPEAFLSRELGMCYVPISIVTDKADLISNSVTTNEMMAAVKSNENQFMHVIRTILLHSDEIGCMPCKCSQAPEEARVNV